MAATYAHAVGSIHAQTGKQVMAAPFFNDAEGLRPAAYGSWWKDVVGGARLDILALQDGTGVGHAKLDDVGEWFRGMF